MKKILRFFFLICTLSFFSGPLAAQDNDGSRVEALKIAYLTKKLDLSPDEAQRFWPVYNNYAGEVKSARSEQRRNQAAELDLEEKILTIRKKYNGEFSKVLSADKVNTFFRSEKEFGNYVQKELQDRRQLRQQLQSGDKRR